MSKKPTWPKDDVHPRVMSEREYGEWARAKIVVLETDLAALQDQVRELEVERWDDFSKDDPQAWPLYVHEWLRREILRLGAAGGGGDVSGHKNDYAVLVDAFRAVGDALQEAGFMPLGDDYASSVRAMSDQLAASQERARELDARVGLLRSVLSRIPDSVRDKAWEQAASPGEEGT